MRKTRPDPLQLTLPVDLNDEDTFSNFYVSPGNRQLYEALQQFWLYPAPVLYLSGEEGFGRSHLLQAVCHQAVAAGLFAPYLPLADLVDYPASALLEDLEAAPLVCIDDVQAIAGHRAWEEGLFHFFNRARECGCHLLIAGAESPAQLSIHLPDLRSRLQWGISYRIVPYDDDELVALLLLRAAQRGIALESGLAHYIVHRARRSPSGLLAVLDQLDHLSLASGRKLTVPFVKAVMAW